MASSYDLELLVRSNRDDGFGVTRRLNEQIRQKLILLLMCIPGERVMNGDFGVGLSQYLFYSEKEFETEVAATLEVRIAEQVAEYMPYIVIESLDSFIAGESHSLGIQIRYSVPQLFDNPADASVQTLQFIGSDGQAIDIAFDGNIPETTDTIYSGRTGGRLGDYYGEIE